MRIERRLFLLAAVIEEPIASRTSDFRSRLTSSLVQALLLSCAALLGGCASAPRIEPGPPSHAIPIGESAFLDREVQKELTDKPGISAVRLVQQNPLAFADRLSTTQRAERSLDVQYYIWHADYTGKLLASELVLAAGRGVRVRGSVRVVRLALIDVLRALGEHRVDQAREFVRGGGNDFGFVHARTQSTSSQSPRPFRSTVKLGNSRTDSSAILLHQQPWKHCCCL